MVAADRVLTAAGTTHPIVKICGIMRSEHALAAAHAGTDMIGMVFAASKRQVTIEAARGITEAVRSAHNPPMMVGVFVNEAPTRTRTIADAVGLDAIQLSGDESLADIIQCANIRPVLRALRFPAGTTVADAESKIGELLALRLGERLMPLIDAYHPDAFGGTGSAADWELAAHLARKHKLMLAGGLTPNNVQRAVTLVAPWGVDVSSGVERDGQKDSSLIVDFVNAACIH